MYPKLVALDTDIITDILEHGAILAIVARSTSKPLYDRALHHFTAVDPKSGQHRSIIDMVKYDEIYEEQKIVHFRKIKEWSKLDYSDMILFDDDAANNIVRVILGVTFHLCPDKRGLTEETYKRGIDHWRRCHQIRSPYLGQKLTQYPKKMMIGYSGMDEDTIKLLTQGKNRVDMEESARWGYASYITDNPAVAQYFRQWIKKDAFKHSQTYVCELWVRDMDLFIATNKIWVPESQLKHTGVKSHNQRAIARTQESRDQTVASQWGVQTPYILFSRHFQMGGMHLPDGEKRFNEMVVYTQVQDALLLTIPLSEEQLQQRLNGRYSRYENRIKEWNIVLPKATVKESAHKDRPPQHQLRDT
ncbi:hypothetical protein CONPUDRAFT_72193 [Coniophora puteana RWD-64-598 SS2]|uniref:Uncharacterized protein n=1 Tax=Coniophora puteana (strain RWD-64-598) TaxID=741705 RepID=A0A5M3MRV9_CONPW|nr:uncharacterized protein CONPUDRAFT_72193 [Coniophora puteana RWD-64-598 SS2]EIW81807.1 hypothetical protein CONPUDRAFT_72193 [Coniophora puteana RWD-64-598 SS2]